MSSLQGPSVTFMPPVRPDQVEPHTAFIGPLFHTEKSGLARPSEDGPASGQ